MIRQSTKQKRRQSMGGACLESSKFSFEQILQHGLDLESPGLEQRLGDVLGVFVVSCPLAQAGGADVLVGGQLELFDDLFGLPRRFAIFPVSSCSARVLASRTPRIAHGHLPQSYPGSF